MKPVAPQRALRVLISAGPTIEPIDPVRYLSNRSEGVMGYEIARSSVRRGHVTTVVSGPVRIAPPVGVKVYPVETADQMKQELFRLLRTHDCLIMAAAVCDFRAKKISRTKLKKTGRRTAYTLELIATEDILGFLKGHYGDSKIFVGFSLESHDVRRASLQKLRRKKLDLIVANPIKRGGPFGKVKNDFYIIDGARRETSYRAISKSRAAQLLLDKVEGLWYGKPR
ncbi:MAG: phosphopantothenoylcysteine decarboxylase [Candidatus Omnitrophica bacterium]|nr:phosphopantothenoylcysteine decarboxylase [Candidatus Omnitrophota bacterium]